METGVLVWLLTAIAILLGGLAVTFRVLRPGRLFLFRHLKPAATLAMLGLALLPGTFLSDPYAALVCLGLLLSAAGDLLLTFPNRFLAGLVCFLLALSAYLAAFLAGIESRATVWAFIALYLAAQAVRAAVWPGVGGGLKRAVDAYIIVMVVMVSLAIGRLELLRTTGAILAAVGALLLLISDALLAVDKFRMRLQRVDLEVLVPYFAGQLLIALSVAAAPRGMEAAALALGSGAVMI